MKILTCLITCTIYVTFSLCFKQPKIFDNSKTNIAKHDTILINTTLRLIIMGFPGEWKKQIFWGKRHERCGVGSFLSKAPLTRFLGLGYVPGGHGEFFPSSTTEEIPWTHISSHQSDMCKYNKNRHKAILLTRNINAAKCDNLLSLIDEGMTILRLS